VLLLTGCSQWSALLLSATNADAQVRCRMLLAISATLEKLASKLTLLEKRTLNTEVEIAATVAFTTPKQLLPQRHTSNVEAEAEVRCRPSC
jgi:hypothetical protein